MKVWLYYKTKTKPKTSLWRHPLGFMAKHIEHKKPKLFRGELLALDSGIQIQNLDDNTSFDLDPKTTTISQSGYEYGVFDIYSKNTGNIRVSKLSAFVTGQYSGSRGYYICLNFYALVVVPIIQTIQLRRLLSKRFVIVKTNPLRFLDYASILFTYLCVALVVYALLR